MKRITKTLFALMMIAGVAVPVMASAATTDSVRVNGTVQYTGLAFGSSICDLVRADYGSCDYIRYDAASNTHVVETAPAMSPMDRLIVKNVNNQIIDDFQVNSGVNHREAVANRLNVSLSQVEWLSGDTEFSRGQYQYEAILLVR